MTPQHPDTSPSNVWGLELSLAGCLGDDKAPERPQCLSKRWQFCSAPSANPFSSFQLYISISFFFVFFFLNTAERCGEMWMEGREERRDEERVKREKRKKETSQGGWRRERLLLKEETATEKRLAEGGEMKGWRDTVMTSS